MNRLIPTLVGFGFLVSSLSFSSGAEAAPRWQPTIPRAAYLELLRIEFTRDAESARLSDFLQSKNPRIVQSAVQALGKIAAGYPLSAPRLTALRALTRDADSGVRAEAAYALGIYRYASPEEKESSRAAVALARSTETTPLALSRQLIALGTVGNADDLANLFQTARTTADPLVRQSAFMGIYATAWDAMSRSQPFEADDEVVRIALEWARESADPDTEIAAQAIYAMAIADRELGARPIAKEMIRAAREAKFDRSRSWLVLSTPSRDPEGLAGKLAAAKDPSPAVRATFAAFVAPYFPDKTVGIPLLIGLLADESPLVAFASSMGLNSLLKDAAARAVLLEQFGVLQAGLTRTVPIGTRSNLLSLLVALSSEKAEPLVRKEVESTDLHARADALLHLTIYRTADDRKRIRTAIESPDAYLSLSALKAVEKLGEAELDEETKTIFDRQIRAARPEAILAAETFAKWTALTKIGAALAVAYPKVKSTGSFAHLDALLSALANAKAVDQLGVVNDALQSSDPRVVKSAKKAFESLTGAPSDVAVPTVVPTTMKLPTLREIETAMDHDFEVTTNRGRYRIRLNPETPFAAVTFLRLVRQRAYVDTTVDWIWPGYMATFGDASNGAGANYALASFPAELVKPFDHVRGAVSYIGPESPDSFTGNFKIGQTYRFYDARTINTQTAFGRVVDGMDVVDRTEVFDRILSIR